MPSWPSDGRYKYQAQVTAMTQNNSKEALKQLRKQRKATIDHARRMIKDQNRQIAAIKAQIKNAPGTVPEIAAALSMPTADTLVFISALRKYGQVVEGAKDGDYFKYLLAD